MVAVDSRCCYSCCS